MSGGSLSMDYAVAESQPIGESSSASFTLDSGFIPVVAFQASASVTPTPSVSAPALSFWGILVLLSILGFISIRKGRLA